MSSRIAKKLAKQKKQQEILEQERIEQEEAAAIAEDERRRKNEKRIESQQNIMSRLTEEGDLVQALAISRATDTLNSETSKEIIDFLQNHEDINVIEQKDALDRLVSPVELVSPAASMRPVRPAIGSVPTLGYSPAFTQTSEDLIPTLEDLTQTSEDLQIEVDNSPENQMVVKEILSDTISSQIIPFPLLGLLEKLDEMYDENKKMKLYRDVYLGLYGKPPLSSLSVEVLKAKIDERFNTRIGWLKRRMNNYVNEYFSFANPIIENIKTALEKFPGNFFTSLQDMDFNIANYRREINPLQVTFFIGYVTLLCIILFINFIASFIKILNDVDSTFGSIIEIITEDTDVLKVRNEYRRHACIQSLGLIEYTFRCININTILRLLFSQLGILGTITIMIIFIAVFRNQSSLFNWFYVIFFKVLLLIVENTPANDVTSKAGKGAAIIFINSQINGATGAVESVGDLTYNSLPSSAQQIVDLTVETTDMITSGASDFYSNVTIAFPLACANISNQIVNANLSSIKEGVTTAVEKTITKAATYTSDVALGHITGINNAAVDFSTIIMEDVMIGTFAFARAVNQISIFGASLIVNKDDVNVTDSVSNNVTDSVGNNVIESLREEVTHFNDDKLFISKVDQQLAMIMEATKEANELLHSPFTPDVEKEEIHMKFIKKMVDTIQLPTIRNQLNVNPHSVENISDLLQRVTNSNNNNTEISQVIDTNAIISELKPMGTTPVFNETDIAIIPQESKNKTQLYKLFSERNSSAMVNITQSSSDLNKLGLTTIPIHSPFTNTVVSTINTAGGLILKCVIPEEDIGIIIQDVEYLGNAINSIYKAVDLGRRQVVLSVYDTTKDYTPDNLDKLRLGLRKRANDIKGASADIIKQTLDSYENIIKIGVVVAGGAALFYVAPVALGLTATLYPSLYTSSVTGLQLVGSVGYRGIEAVGSTSYLGFNYLFFPTARFGVYMLSKWFDFLSKKTIGDIGVQRIVFGDTGMYLSFGSSIEPIIDTVTPYYDVAAPIVQENALAFSSKMSIMGDELGVSILLNPNYVAAYATVMLASSASAIVGAAIYSDLNNILNEPNIGRLRGSYQNILNQPQFELNVSRSVRPSDKILLNTPRGSDEELVEEHLKSNFELLDPSEQDIVMKQYEEFKQKRYSELSPEQKKLEDDVRANSEEIRFNLPSKDKEEDDEYVRRAKKEGLRIFTDKIYLPEKKRKLAEAEKKRADEEGYLAVLSGFFKGGASKNTRKRRVKKSTRKYNKKSGKKGKSNKKKRSNKKHRHSRR